MKLTKEEKAKVKKAEREKLAAEAITLHIAGLTTREIAKRLNSSAATISRILTGKTPIPTTTTIIAPTKETQPTNSTGLNTLKASPSSHHIVDTNEMVANINEAISGIIDQIAFVTPGTTSIDKLAVAADKLAAVAERIANIQRIANQQNQDNATANTFISDFANRHLSDKKA